MLLKLFQNFQILCQIYLLINPWEPSSVHKTSFSTVWFNLIISMSLIYIYNHGRKWGNQEEILFSGKSEWFWVLLPKSTHHMLSFWKPCNLISWFVFFFIFLHLFPYIPCFHEMDQKSFDKLEAQIPYHEGHGNLREVTRINKQVAGIW
jgi:hypothetical protein